MPATEDNGLEAEEVSAYSNGSSEDEPWDQREMATTSSMDSSTMRAVAVHEQLLLEEGDLPPLKSNDPAPKLTAAPPKRERANAKTPPRAGWLLRGQRTRRPLQPPSMAGLEMNEDGDLEPPPQIPQSESEKRRQNNFWSQLDTGSFEDEEDGPDDEIAARKSEDELDRKIGSLDDEEQAIGSTENNSVDNHSTAEETIDYSQEGSKNAEGATGGDFCGETLNALNDMCGGLEQTNSTEPQDPPATSRAISAPRVPLKSDDQEEYTAIEVEFVESSQQQRSPGRSPPKKQLEPEGVTVAKDNGEPVEEANEKFNQKHQPQQEGPPEPESTKRTAFLSALARKAKADFDKGKAARQKMDKHQAIERKSSGDSLDDNVYSTFSPSEKRKFLKLINTGQLPVEASRNILEEREAKEKAKTQKKESAINRKNQRSKRLAFWKKNRPSSSANGPSSLAAASSSRSADEADADEAAYVDDNEEEEFESEEEEELSNSQLNIPQEPIIPTAAMTAMIALDEKTPRPETPPAPPPPLEEMEPRPGRDEESEEERFARSGINYYDAVRRDASDTDDDVAQAESMKVATPTDKKKRRIRPRGFAALRDGVRSKSAPRASRIPETVSEDEPEIFSTQTRTNDSITTNTAKPREPVALAPSNESFDKKAQTRGGVRDKNGISSVAASNGLKDRGLQTSLRTPKTETRERAVGDGDRIETPSRQKGRVVKDVSTSEKIGQSDEEMLARIEQEILRSSTPKKAELLAKKHVAQVPQKQREPVLPPKAKPRAASTPKLRPTNMLAELEKEEKEFKLDLDLDMDTYLHSADVYSSVQVPGKEIPHSDARSVHTAGTGASGYTHSSRKRRPGAAKSRLAKAKEAFQKHATKKGWHDSIQAAAASTNRVWKPGTGWVDYVDTLEQEIADTPKSEEKIRINLKKAIGRDETRASNPSLRSVVPVPFPKEWEEERETMLSPVSPPPPHQSPAPSQSRSISQPRSAPVARSVPQTRSFPVHSSPGPIDVLGDGMPTEPSPNEPLPVQLGETPSPLRRSEKVKRIKKHFSPARTRLAQKPEKQTGWHASMQAATAPLSKDGKYWDNENGWTVPDKEIRIVSDVVDFNEPSHSREISEAVDYNEPTFSHAPPPPPPPGAKSSKTRAVSSQGVDRTDDTDVRRLQTTSSPPLRQSHPREPDGKLTQWVEKSGRDLKAGSSAADMSERAVASGASAETGIESSRRLLASGVSTTPDPESSSGVAEARGVNSESKPGSSRRTAKADGVSTETDPGSSRRIDEFAGVTPEIDAGRSRRTVDAAGVSTESDPGSSRRIAVDTAAESVHSESAQNVAVAGTSTERYVQLGDNGSVRAHENQMVFRSQNPVKFQPKAETNNGREEAEVDLSNDELGAFPSMGHPASAVDKQKINDEDLNLFPIQTREKRVDRGVVPGDHRKQQNHSNRPDPPVSPPASPRPAPPMSPPPPPSVPPGISHTSSVDSSRRGGGPVDMDEVDETWDSEDEQRFSTGWESKSGSASISPNPTPNRSIPKLKGSKRDTSPLSSRRQVHRPGPEMDVLSDFSASKPEEKSQDGRGGPSASQGGIPRPSERGEREAYTPPEWPDETDEIHHSQESRPAAEWKSFIGKKVNAEAAAASQQRAQVQGTRGRSEDEDSIFEFEEKKQSNGSPRELERPDLSPINAREQYSDEERPSYSDVHGAESDVYGSEGYGPTPQDGRTFLQRLTECAAPVVASARNTMGDLPSAHLAFMKAGQFSPTKGCVKPDVIDEKEEPMSRSVDGETPRSPSTRNKTRSKSNPKPRPRGGSSVASDDFGAKTAYLEAIAMKAAVSKPRRSSSRGRGSSSVASSSTSQHSEKWKTFLERKKASGTSPGQGRGSTTSDVSKAAERYADSKVDEMMSEMNANSVSSPGAATRDVILRNEYSGDDDDYRAMRSYRKRDGSRVGAAQDLAAARVEAMMTQLSGGQDDEEGEI